MDEETTESPVTVHKRMQENKTKRHRTGSNERTKTSAGAGAILGGTNSCPGNRTSLLTPVLICAVDVSDKQRRLNFSVRYA